MNIDYEPAPPEQRRDRFQLDNNQCRLCGVGSEDYAVLEAHHITPVNEGGDHSLENLITLCHECHRSYHSLKRLRAADFGLGALSYEPTPSDLMVVLAVGAHGKATTRTIASTVGKTIEGTSQRCYKLTALNVLEPTVDLHSQTKTAKWGFRGTVENSAVGQLPSDSKKAARLARDEMIRMRADQGISHGTLAEELGLSRRTIIKSIDRARALRPPVPNITSTEYETLLRTTPESLRNE